MKREYSTEEILEMIEMDVKLRDDQPSCNVGACFLEPQPLLIVRLFRYLFRKKKKEEGQ